MTEKPLNGICVDCVNEKCWLNVIHKNSDYAKKYPDFPDVLDCNSYQSLEAFNAANYQTEA